MTEQNVSYLMAETVEERVAIGFVNFLEIWYASNQVSAPIPEVEFVKVAIRPYVMIEILNRVYGELGLKEKTINDRQNTLANEIMLEREKIQKSLKPEHL